MRDEMIVHVLEADAAGDSTRGDRLARLARALDAELAPAARMRRTLL